MTHLYRITCQSVLYVILLSTKHRSYRKWVSNRNQWN